MLKTKFPYDKVDYDKYFNEYMKREDAIKSVPSEAELKELARKGIVKDNLVLKVLPEGEKAQLGDTITFKTESRLTKFNKEKVTVSIGRGLYNKELECRAEGKLVGDSYELTVREESVKVTILEIKRKQEPETPTDEMVVALQEKNSEGKLITTVAEYEEFVKKEKVMECLATINYYVMEPLLKDYPVTDCDEEDIKILGDLERVFFRKIYKETEGIDVDTLTEEQANEMWGEQVASFDDFIRLRYEWYKMKIQQCMIYRNVLRLDNDPKYDYTDHYEVLSELTELMYEKIKKMLEGVK